MAKASSPHLIDNDHGEITVSLNGRELRSWWRGVQRLMLVVEDQLEKADDVNVTVEQMVSRAATMIPAGADREKFKRHFRVLIQPLVELELKRRAGDVGEAR